MQWALWFESEIFERRRYTIVQARRVCNGFQTKMKGFSVQLFLPQGFSRLSKSNIFFWHGSSPLPATKLRPCLHQLAALLEQVAASVCGLHRVGNGVRERHLGNLAREVRALGSPVAERRAQAMHRNVGTGGLLGEPHRRDHAHRSTRAVAGENVV